MFRYLSAITAAAFIAAAGTPSPAAIPAQARQAGQDTQEQPPVTLTMGDKAPEIKVAKWIKGGPISGFEKGRTYVVEFWTPWCIACREAIPHLTELQIQNKDVRFVGVAVWEKNQDAVKAFVEKTGDDMAYAVAADDTGAEGEEGWMARTWMKAAGLNSIPNAFIVNGEGRIAWIGHPKKIDEPLKQILAGKWDLENEARAYRELTSRDSALRAAVAEIDAARRAHNAESELAAIERALKLNPDATSKYGEPLNVRKFVILLNELKQPGKAYPYGAELVDGPIRDNALALNMLAWTIVDPEAMPAQQDLPLALKAAQRASELTRHKEPAIIDTLAKVHFDLGDLDKAIELQEKAVKLAEGTQWETELRGRLAEFREAARKKAK